MRLAGLIALAALLVPAAAAADQSGLVQNPAPVSLMLAPDEVLLEVDATGSAKSRPDTTRLFATAKSQGETAARARSLNATLIARVTDAARRAGVAPTDIRPASSPWSRFGFVGNELGEAALPALVRQSGKTETASLEIRVRDLNSVEAVRAALEEAGVDQVIGPVFSLENDASARRAAKADAVRRARAEADDYARALGMRVTRILRVSERIPPYGNSDAMEAMFATLYGIAGPSQGEIETTVNLAVDFALEPAR